MSNVPCIPMPTSKQELSPEQADAFVQRLLAQKPQSTATPGPGPPPAPGATATAARQGGEGAPPPSVAPPPSAVKPPAPAAAAHPGKAPDRAADPATTGSAAAHKPPGPAIAAAAPAASAPSARSDLVLVAEALTQVRARRAAAATAAAAAAAARYAGARTGLFSPPPLLGDNAAGLAANDCRRRRHSRVPVPPPSKPARTSARLHLSPAALAAAAARAPMSPMSPSPPIRAHGLRGASRTHIHTH